MRPLQRALVYFLLVFGTGFILGVLRVTLLVPRIGERWAELCELPLMLLAVILAAGWINRRFFSLGRHAATAYLAYGWLAFAILVAFEFLLGYLLRGQSPVESIRNRDPVSGPAYYFSLVMFALMPWLLSRLALRRA